jgi:hypothetical protein
VSINFNKAIQTDTIDIPLNIVTNGMDHPIYFTAQVFQDILKTNKDAKKSTMKLSNGGLLTMTFVYEGLNVVYWFVASKLDDGGDE